MTANDLFVIGSLVLYLSALLLFAYYAAQNSQPARRAVDELVESPAVAAGWRELADAVYGPAGGEVRDAGE